MTRINALRRIFSQTEANRDCVAWGKNRLTECNQTNIQPENTWTRNIAPVAWGNINALVFGAVLIVCSVAVGCSSEQPKNVSSNNQIPITQPQTPSMPAPASTAVAEKKPAPKKVVHKKPATVNYTDKAYGVAFEYPRRYAIETGNAATDLVLSNPLPMNFVQPGGVALAAVEMPLTGYANTDFSSAFFDVSVHKNLTADQCTEFAVPQPKTTIRVQEAAATPDAKIVQPPASSSTETASTQVASTPAENAKTSTDVQSSQPASAQSSSTQSASIETAAPASMQAATAITKSDTAAPSAQSQTEAQGAKLLLGDMELHATEAVSGEGTQQSDSKYFHVYQNGACYEFALNVTTVASQEGLIKHVDRDKVFSKLETILDTVKINPVATQEVTAETSATSSQTSTAAATPAQ
jgi:hypothetical protein